MSNTIENPYENFIALSRYARWLEDENRRETWGETVDRYFKFMVIQLREKHGMFQTTRFLQNFVMQYLIVTLCRQCVL